MNKEIINQLKTTKTVDELKDLAAKNGYTLNDEEANRYFDLFHAEGKIADEELNNVAGGACSLSRNGKFYSGDGDHYLIVTFGNCCEYFVEDKESPGLGKNCYNCDHSCMGSGLTLYCHKRTFANDPLNPSILPEK